MQNTYRPAIVMVELIFALVVMGITILSAPMLISQATKSSMVSLQQESIAIAASHTNALLTYSWDEQNTQSQLSYINTILKVSHLADDELNASNRVSPGVRKFNVSDPNAIATSLLGADVNTANENDDDIDDFIDTNLTLTLASNSVDPVNQGDYIDQTISLSTDVKYMDDNTTYHTSTGVIVFNIPKTFVNQTTNIKYITTTLTSTSNSIELNTKKIIFHAFMCNIGAAKPQSSKNMNTGQLHTAPLGRF